MGGIMGILKPDMKVLLSLPMYPTNKLLSKHLKLDKGYVSRLIKGLKQKGLVKEKILFNTKEFYPTKRGIEVVANFLALSEATDIKQLPLRTHDLRWSAKIIRKPRNIKKKLEQENWVEATPKNWTQQRKSINDVTVLFNPNTIQFFPKPFFSSNVEEVRHNQLKQVTNAIRYLENKYKGLKIGEPESTMAKLKAQSTSRLYDPISLLFNKKAQEGNKITYFGENIDVDFSKGYPEVDYKHKSMSTEHLLKSAQLYDEWFSNRATTPNEIMDFVLKSQKNNQEMLNDFAKELETHRKQMNQMEKMNNTLNKTLNLTNRAIQWINEEKKKIRKEKKQLREQKAQKNLFNYIG